MSQADSSWGRGQETRYLALSVQFLNLASFFSLIFLKDEEVSLNLGRKEGRGLFTFPWIYLPLVFCEAIRILENTVGSNLTGGGKPAQA